MTVALAPGYALTTEAGRLDPARVHALLVQHCSWATHRPREHTDRLLSGGRHYGVLRGEDDALVGYARIVTDEVTFAWLADVVVEPSHRGRGLARALVDAVLADLEPLGLKRVLLKASAEGRGLYEQAGWVPVEAPGTWMERRSGIA